MDLNTKKGRHVKVVGDWIYCRKRELLARGCSYSKQALWMSSWPDRFSSGKRLDSKVDLLDRFLPPLPSNLHYQLEYTLQFPLHHLVLLVRPVIIEKYKKINTLIASKPVSSLNLRTSEGKAISGCYFSGYFTTLPFPNALSILP